MPGVFEGSMELTTQSQTLINISINKERDLYNSRLPDG